MGGQAVVQSWREPLDLDLLKTCFYGEDGEMLWSAGDACQLVHAQAAVGRLPHAVQATAELTHAVLDGNNENIPAETKANSLCTAWIRFVNGMTDTQQSYRTKQSMYRIARQLRLPASFIELRHRVTHEDKPKLHELQHAAKQGLRWLHDWYWADLHKTTSICQEVDGSPMSMNNVNKTFSDQMKIVLDEMSSNNLRKGLEEGASVAQAARKIAQKCCGMDGGLKMLIQVLIQHFLPRSWSTTGGRRLRTEEHGRAPLVDSHDPSFHIFDRLILLLARTLPHFLLTFESSMLAELARPDTREPHPVREGCIFWLLHIYTDSTWKRHSSWCLLSPKLALQLCIENTSVMAKDLLHELDKDSLNVSANHAAIAT